MGMGKVWLVGAGPGERGLLTIKGMEVLQQAQVVVYDRLVGEGILTAIPADAKLIDVGKRANNHTMPQEKINEVLLEEARKGYRVVRLKGGDPFLFGRGGEELELLAKNGVPYEVVPGVTSPLAVPAYNGIPVTHRDFCSSLHIVTGHKRAGESYDIDFKALVVTGGTLVFLMGVSALSDICEGLLGAGMEPDMPAAILQKGTTARQKRIVATVATLREEVQKRGVQTPAIIVVGKVCALADRFAWYEKLPLAGCRVVVTRPRDLVSRTASLLREKGAEVLELPSIRTVPIVQNETLYRSLDAISSYDWLVFTSPTGAQVFFDTLRERKKDIRSLGGVRVAAIGTGTAKKLEERGLYADLMPETYDGDSLGAALVKRLKGGERILIPRAEKGNANLVKLLEDAGAQVDDVASYRTVYEESRLIDEKEEFEGGAIDCAVFTSASTVRGFAGRTRGMDYTKVCAACIGRQTQAAARELGMHAYVAKEATIESLVSLVEEMHAEKRRKADDDE